MLRVAVPTTPWLMCGRQHAPVPAGDMACAPRCLWTGCMRAFCEQPVCRWVLGHLIDTHPCEVLSMPVRAGPGRSVYQLHLAGDCASYYCKRHAFSTTAIGLFDWPCGANACFVHQPRTAGTFIYMRVRVCKRRGRVLVRIQGDLATLPMLRRNTNTRALPRGRAAPMHCLAQFRRRMSGCMASVIRPVAHAF